MEQPQRKPVKEAVQACVAFLKDVSGGAPPEEVTVEEVALSEDARWWEITLGYYAPGSSMDRLVGKAVPRQYKQFEVDAASGDVLSMRIRKV